MIQVGVIGLGERGQTHLDAYARRLDARVVAVADHSSDRLKGRVWAQSGTDGQEQPGADLSAAIRYKDAMDLVNDPDVELVDICLPTPLHFEYAMAAIAAGKHVLIEKPLARTHEQAMQLVKAAEAAPGSSVMVGMCMRFWPGWDWLKTAIDQKTYGRVLSATFLRVAEHPGGEFFRDGEASGGALLELHIHDTDFVRYCFGTPHTVSSHGYARITGRTDHVFTQYVYPDGPVVSAEGGWAMADGFGFSMRYVVNFENATVDFEYGRTPALKLIRNGKIEEIEIPDWLGYDCEIGYFLDCITIGLAPHRVTLADAAESIRLVEAEERSIETGKPVVVGPSEVSS